MKDLKHIRNRIHNRHGDRYYNYRNTRTRSAPSRFYRFVVTCMTLIVLVLGGITFAKTPLYIDMQTKVEELVPQLSNMLSKTFLSKFIPFEKWFAKEIDQPVTTSSQYEPGSSTGYFTNENNEAIALYDGLVVYIGDEKGIKWIVVHHDNALYATYGNLDEVYVKIYDRVLKSTVIGGFHNEMQLEFLYENEDISYEQAKQLED